MSHSHSIPNVKTDLSRESKSQFYPEHEIIPLDETQSKMDKRSAAAMRIAPTANYTIADRLENQATADGAHPFILHGNEVYTYAQINRQADCLAFALQQVGVQRGDTIAIALENRPAFFVAWFAIAKLGAVTAFINTHVSGKPLEHAIETIQAKGVIVGDECAKIFAQTQNLADIPMWRLADSSATEVDLSLLPQLSNALEETQKLAPIALDFKSHRKGIEAQDPMLLIFTSGTTGLPKAAVYSHLRWLCSGDVMEVTIGADKDDVFYCCLPLYHGAAATSVTSTALAAGATIFVRRKFSVSQFWDEVIAHKVTVVQYIGEICRYLLHKAQAPDENPVRVMMGAGLTEKAWRAWLDKFGSVEIYEGWGSTEANTNLINLDNYIGACGRVPDWQRTNFRLVKYDVENACHVRNEEGFLVLCEPGEIGEGIGYIVQDPNIGVGRFEGYSNAAENDKKILRNVFEKGDMYWSSGDLLRYDENRYFYFVDRIGDTFRWKSENVSTQEVAQVLGGYPGIELINIYGVQVPEHEGRAGMAAIVMQAGHTLDLTAFYDFVEKQLPHYARPVFLRISATADLTSTFKLRKLDLQKQGYCPKLCHDPLFIKHDDEAQYVPLNEHTLNELGFLPFNQIEEGIN